MAQMIDFKVLLRETDCETSNLSVRQISHKLFNYANVVWPQFFPRKSRFRKEVDQRLAAIMKEMLGHVRQSRMAGISYDRTLESACKALHSRVLLRDKNRLDA